MALVCKGTRTTAVWVLVLLVTAVAAVTGLGVVGALLAFAYVAAAGMLIGLLLVASTRKGY